MEDKIKAALKKVGLSENLWTKVKVTKEEEIEGAVNTLKEVIPASLDKFLEQPENSELKKEYELLVQKEGDKRVTQGIDTFKKKHGLTDEKLKELEKPEDNEDEKKKLEKMDETQKAIHELTKTVGTLTDTVKSMKTDTTTEVKITQAKALLKKEELDEELVSNLNLDSETPLEEQVSKLKEKITGIKAEAIKNAVDEGGKLKKSEKDIEVSTKSAIDKFVEEQKTDGKTPILKI